MTREFIDAFKLPTADERGAEYIKRLVLDFSLTPQQAAGLVGNLLFESAGFSTLQEMKPSVPGSAGGYGIAQWTGPRRRAFEKWASVNGLDTSTDGANYGFLCEELRTTHKNTLTALRKCLDIEGATWSVGQTYERPGGTTKENLPGYNGRLSYARRALVAYLGEAPMPVELDEDVAADKLILEHLITAIQLLVGVDDDGILGPNTIAAIQKAQKL